MSLILLFECYSFLFFMDNICTMYFYNILVLEDCDTFIEIIIILFSYLTIPVRSHVLISTKYTYNLNIRIFIFFIVL
jgi:hypothetical protein